MLLLPGVAILQYFNSSFSTVPVKVPLALWMFTTFAALMKLKNIKINNSDSCPIPAVRLRKKNWKREWKGGWENRIFDIWFLIFELRMGMLCMGAPGWKKPSRLVATFFYAVHFSHCWTYFDFVNLNFVDSLYVMHYSELLKSCFQWADASRLTTEIV